MVEISVSSPLWRNLPRARRLARETIAASVAESKFVSDHSTETSLVLASDAEVRILNARWRGIDKATNVLSFPAALLGRSTQPRNLGDIAIAYETVAHESEEEGVPLADHFCHLVAHGFLHLIGYHHETDVEAERMEALEKRILSRLGVPDPYGDGVKTE